MRLVNTDRRRKDRRKGDRRQADRRRPNPDQIALFEEAVRSEALAGDEGPVDETERRQASSDRMTPSLEAWRALREEAAGQDERRFLGRFRGRGG